MGIFNLEMVMIVLFGAHERMKKRFRILEYYYETKNKYRNVVVNIKGSIGHGRADKRTTTVLLFGRRCVKTKQHRVAQK